MMALAVTDDVTEMPVLRPLIGMGQQMGQLQDLVLGLLGGVGRGDKVHHLQLHPPAGHHPGGHGAVQAAGEKADGVAPHTHGEPPRSAAARQVFGVVSVARAVPCEKTVESIVETAKDYLADAFAGAGSFKVESKRADKNYPLNSIQLSQAVGGELAEAFPQVTVDVHNPDLTVHVEILEKHA